MHNLLRWTSKFYNGFLRSSFLWEVSTPSASTTVPELSPSLYKSCSSIIWYWLFCKSLPFLNRMWVNQEICFVRIIVRLQMASSSYFGYFQYVSPCLHGLDIIKIMLIFWKIQNLIWNKEKIPFSYFLISCVSTRRLAMSRHSKVR